MIFSVTNLGPVEEVKMNFDGKTLVVGPNSSGKTMISTAFYFINFPISFSPLSTDNELSLEVEEGINEIEVSLKDLVSEKALKGVIGERIRTLFNAEPKDLITIGESKGFIENDLISVELNSDNHVGVTLKEDKRMKILVNFKRTEEVKF
ncbi:hypothetical protein HS7_02580 [Sulfolobales archaeon HS-7]|nr:hypothetical protein HS7_02580 [Sulfolobales archaeon HS-7]